jgi:hypothetical protein
MIKRYSIEYCGGMYLLVERNQSIVIYESLSMEQVIKYAKENNIKFIDEEG